MEEKLISFELAILSKERGFNERGVNSYLSNGELTTIYGEYPAPTQSLLQKWLREIHGIDLSIYSDKNPVNALNAGKCDKFYDCLVKDEKGNFQQLVDHKTYEDALEAGLKEALALIK